MEIKSGGMGMIGTFIILIVSTIFFIHGKYRADLVALGSLLLLALTGIITPVEALAGFSNSVVIMIAGLFVVGAGIFNTGLAIHIGNQLLKLGNNNEKKLFIIIMITVGVFSAFMSNTGTVAVLLPVVISMALNLNVSPAKFLIPLAFASSLGGVLTLIGTPPNLVSSNTLAENGFQPMHFFQYTPIGLVAFAVGILFMVTVGKKLLPDNKAMNTGKSTSFSANELAGFYKIYHSLHLIEIPETSQIIGKKLSTLELTTKYGITVISIERKENELIPLFKHVRITPKTDTVFEQGDKVLLFGDAAPLFTEFDLTDLTNESEAKRHFLAKQYGLTEVLIAPQSSFKNKTIRELQFREKYRCSVLAISRNGEYIQTNASKEKLRLGDALIIYGEWEKIELLAEKSADVVVVGRVSDKATSAAAQGKAPIAGGIMLFMLLLMTLELVDPVLAVLLSAFLMIITGCVRSTGDAYHKINWESVVLIAAMLPMATALEKTGGVTFMSDLLLGILGDYGPHAVLAGFYVLTMVLSQFISNTATAVIFAPIAITTAINLGVSPYPFVVAVAISASMAFATPVASPTNALVMNAGGYTFKDFVKVGVPLQLVLTVVLIAVIPLLYPF
ncbi:SLC13 family permease [Virgibacillus sp. C22-A2]|uniref:SLC13 family permease n=1 Tax=Virgibacillus tibetensis TaxID=3042313 RepID=A0ABU6KD23_9BACI|nr:SLC13 family permease [Virgibacillus sp. C22-A2]